MKLQCITSKNTKNSSTDSSVQQSSEDTNTNNESSNALPVKNTKSVGTYKILPLYSESSEKVANPASSEHADKKEVTSTDTSESQDSHNPMKIDNTDTKTLSSEQPQQSEETTAHDTSKPKVTDSMDEQPGTDSVFGLRMKSLGEDTKNQLDNKIQKLKERAPEQMHLFGSIG
jgi:hypothetical protein